MKKMLSIFLCMFFIFITFAPAYATQDIENKEYAEDGSYILEIIGDPPKSENEQDNIFIKILEMFRKIINILTGKKTVTKTKYVYYYSSDNSLLWTLYLTAEFTYTKNEAVCNKATVTSQVYDADWKVVNAVASKNNNTAKGEFTVKQTKLGVPLKTINKTITIACDNNGNIK